MVTLDLIDKFVEIFEHIYNWAVPSGTLASVLVANGYDLLEMMKFDLLAYRAELVNDMSRTTQQTSNEAIIRKLQAYFLYRRMDKLISAMKGTAPLPEYNLPAPQSAWVARILDPLFGEWKVALAGTPSIHFWFGQMRVAQNFSGQKPDMRQREIEMCDRPINVGAVNSVSAKDLGYGMGCRLNVFLGSDVRIFHLNNRNIPTPYLLVLNNRTMAAHCLTRTRPLNLVFNELTPAEKKRLVDVEGEDGVPPLRFTPGHNRPQGASNPRTLPANWMPVEDHEGGTVIDIATIPSDWSENSL